MVFYLLLHRRSDAQAIVKYVMYMNSRLVNHYTVELSDRTAFAIDLCRFPIPLRYSGQCDCGLRNVKLKLLITQSLWCVELLRIDKTISNENSIAMYEKNKHNGYGESILDIEYKHSK